jgi:predicted RNA methylase
MNDLEKSISTMIVDGNNLRLPEGKMTNYPAVKKALTTAGGKYERGGFFSFKEDAAVIQSRLAGGEVINNVKKFQYYPTPAPLAQELVKRAGIERRHTCMEPSAGQGAIAQFMECYSLWLIEIMPQNIPVLHRTKFLSKHTHVIEKDFLSINANFNEFDRVVANPPFTKNQDIKHVIHMMRHLALGGRVVSVMSNSWRSGSHKIQKAFRQFISDSDSAIVDIPAGAFKESGTNIASCYVVIDFNENNRILFNKTLRDF